MALPQFGNRVVDAYGARITDLVGGNLRGVTFKFGNGGNSSVTRGNVISINRGWWEDTSKRDRIGTLVHELTHVATRNQGLGGDDPNKAWAANGIEVGADAVRYALTGAHGINQDTLGASRRLANKEGWTDMGTNGPGMAGLGSHNGRMRNTFANAMSKTKIDYQNPGGAQALPALSPEQNANYYNQLAGLYAGYQNQLDALKQQRLGIKGGYRETVAQTRAQEVADLAGTQNAGIERGMLGSSAESQQEIGVRAGAAGAIASAQQQKLLGLGQTQVQAQQAGVQYFMGAQGLEQQKLAQQQSALTAELQNNLIISGQESSMDVLRAIYESMQNPTKPRNPQPTGPPLTSNNGNFGIYNRTGGGPI